MRRNDDEMELALAAPVPAAVPPRQDVRPEPSDGDLLRRIASRDADAFDVLYERYARPVYGLALRRLGDRQRAEDALQETFAAIWRSARSYKPERGPGAPWLYAVARNAIADRARARRDEYGDVPETESPDAHPDEEAESAYVAWRVHRALEDLPAHEREVVELAYWGGLSQSEVASFLGIPLGTVKTRTRAALARLASLLEEELR